METLNLSLHLLRAAHLAHETRQNNPGTQAAASDAMRTVCNVA